MSDFIDTTDDGDRNDATFRLAMKHLKDTGFYEKNRGADATPIVVKQAFMVRREYPSGRSINYSEAIILAETSEDAIALMKTPECGYDAPEKDETWAATPLSTITPMGSGTYRKTKAKAA